MAELGQSFAHGRTAEVFEWGENRVLKLFLASMPDWWADNEMAYNEAVMRAGLPCARLFDVIELEGRRGLVFERVDGPSIKDLLGVKPWLSRHMARLLAELQVQVNQCTAEIEIQTQRDWLRPGIERVQCMPMNVKSHVLEVLDGLPDGDSLCHGDMHPANVLITDDGPVIIDWATVSRGQPLGDVARSATLMGCGEMPDDMPAPHISEWFRDMIIKTYVKRYFHLSPIDRRLWHAWRAVMAANMLDIISEREYPATLGVINASLEAMDSMALAA